MVLNVVMLFILKPRPHNRKTASQMQLAASLTQKLACRSGTSNVGVLISAATLGDFSLYLGISNSSWEMGNNFENPSKYREIVYQCQKIYF